MLRTAPTSEFLSGAVLKMAEAFFSARRRARRKRQPGAGKKSGYFSDTAILSRVAYDLSVVIVEMPEIKESLIALLESRLDRKKLRSNSLNYLLLMLLSLGFNKKKLFSISNGQISKIGMELDHATDHNIAPEMLDFFLYRAGGSEFIRARFRQDRKRQASGRPVKPRKWAGTLTREAMQSSSRLGTPKSDNVDAGSDADAISQGAKGPSA